MGTLHICLLEEGQREGTSSRGGLLLKKWERMSFSKSENVK
jgi:hypothetical protein